MSPRNNFEYFNRHFSVGINQFYRQKNHISHSAPSQFPSLQCHVSSRSGLHQLESKGIN